MRLALSKGPFKVGVSPSHLRTETDPRVITSTFLSLTYMPQGPIPDLSARYYALLLSRSTVWNRCERVRHIHGCRCMFRRTLWKLISVNCLPKWSQLACTGSNASLLFCLCDLQNNSAMASVIAFYNLSMYILLTLLFFMSLFLRRRAFTYCIVTFWTSVLSELLWRTVLKRAFGKVSVKHFEIFRVCCQSLLMNVPTGAEPSPI
jgi:hypothetical protein